MLEEFSQWKGTGTRMVMELMNVGLWIPSCEGDIWIYPVLATYSGDLQELYRLARRKGSNYELLNAACNNCDIPGYGTTEIGNLVSEAKRYLANC